MADTIWNMSSILLASTRTIEHVLPPVIDGQHHVSAPPPTACPGTEQFITAAGHAGRLLAPAVHDALVDFVDSPHRSGALLLRNMPLGRLPATPATPTTPTDKDNVSEFTLLTVARRLGQPVGYAAEHGGDLIQNIVPTALSSNQQVSTSSKVTLMFHTEAAFHPYRPRYLLLLCLRGDPAAGTTLSSIHEVLPRLEPDTRAVLFEPRFRTAVDTSHLHGRQNVLGAPMAVLSGQLDHPTMVFDADLMVGTDPEADEALQRLSAAVASFHTAVVLQPGDLLVVDNAVAVHGRTSFMPRFDGTDRWLQRVMVVESLAPSAADRDGRVITTLFGV